MTTTLEAVATQGWFTEQDVVERLTPVATFGWFLEFVPLGDPDLICFVMTFNRLHELDICL